MSDTPICDANYFDSEPHGYGVVPLCVAKKMERELNRLKERNMQTIPSNLNAEELLRWYDSTWSTWNKLMNSEMEQRLAAALKEALDKLDDAPDKDKLEKEYEMRLEQSDFRAQLIQEILELCDQAGTKVELVKAIKLALEDSYVEL